MNGAGAPAPAAAPGQVQLVKSMHGTLRMFLRNVQPGYEFSIDDVEAIVFEACRQHLDHLEVHDIEQHSIDPMKLACWLGGALLSKIDADNDHHCEVIIRALLKMLRGILISESKWFLLMPPSAMELLERFLMAERRKNFRHGIWMNGLYAAFHCPLVAWKEGKAYKIPL